MTQKYSFFDAVDGAPEYTAQDVANRTAELAGGQSGYLVGSREQLAVVATGSEITLRPGAALVQGRLYINDADVAISVPLCSSGKIRQDRVVIKLDTAVESRSITAYLKQGIEGISGISPPSLTRAGTVYELSVARLDVTDAAVTVSDERGTSTCPALHTGEAAAQASLGHAARADNPHGVTKAQVGLDSVDNTADTDKPLSTAVTNALANYLLKSNIINNLVTGGIDKALSAEQGKTLKSTLDELIDSGSNANGSYTKLPDGTLICTGTKTYPSTTFAPTGSVYYAVLSAIVFPTEFLAAPIVTASIEMGNIGAVQVGAITTTQFASIVLSDASAARDPIVRYIAIGRWRA